MPPCANTLYGTQVGSVPSSAERHTASPVAGSVTTSSARWIFGIEKKASVRCDVLVRENCVLTSYDQPAAISPREPIRPRNDELWKSFWRPPPSTLRRPIFSGTKLGSARNGCPVAGLMVAAASAAGAPQPIVVACCADRSGLSQLIEVVSPKKMPPGAICATERTSVNISWV